MSDTGQQLPGLYLSPLLNIGEMFACLQLIGRRHLRGSAEILSPCRHIESGVASSFRIFAGSRSGPQAL